MTTQEQSERYEQTPETSCVSGLGGSLAATEAMPRDFDRDMFPEHHRSKPTTVQAQAMTDDQVGMKTVCTTSEKQSQRALSQDRRGNQHKHSGSEQRSATDVEHTTSSTQINPGMGGNIEVGKPRVHDEVHSIPWNQSARRALMAPTIPKDDHTKQLQTLVHKLRQKGLEQNVQIQLKDEAIARLQNTILDHQKGSDMQAQQYERAVSERTLQLEKQSCEVVGAQAEISALRKDLEDCKGRIFAMQPVQGMTDTQLLDLYRDLCQNIEDCVETCFDDVDNALISMANAQQTESRGSLVLSHFVLSELEATVVHSSIDKPMLGSFIFRVLYDGILKEDLPVPGLPEECEWLLNAPRRRYGRLASSERPDHEACQMWSLDMHRALRATQVVKECENFRLAEIAGSLLKSFESVVPKEKRTPMNKDKLDKIISMAAELASNARLNMAEYGFSFGVNPQDAAENMVMFAKELRSYVIIDSRTGLPLRSNSQPHAAPDGRVGETVTWVFPGIVRFGTKEERNMELCKPVIVVKFDHEIPRGGKRKAIVEKDQDCNMSM